MVRVTRWQEDFAPPELGHLVGSRSYKHPAPTELFRPYDILSFATLWLRLRAALCLLR